MKNVFVILSLLFYCSCGGNKPVEPKVELLPIMEKALNDVNSRFYINFAEFPKDKKSLPIGVFDSGTGGLTVQEVFYSIDKIDNITGELRSDGIPDFEGEDFTYLADRANMPYGNYAAANKELFFRELIIKDALFLLGDKYYLNNIDKKPLGVKKPAKILVIACNTATAFGLNDIKTLLGESGTGVKVIGVINAGVNALFDMLNKLDTLSISNDSLTIGVLATVGTISSGAYERTIKEVKEETKYKGFIKVVNQSGAGFAEAVDMEADFVDTDLKAPRESYRGPKIGLGEEDIKLSLLPIYNFDFSGNNVLVTKDKTGIKELQLNSAANYARFHLVSLLEKHKVKGESVPMKHVILGCTHYPFLLDSLTKVVTELREYKENDVYKYRDIIAEDFSFIDPAVFTAIECYRALRADNNLALNTSKGKLDAYISVPVYGLPSANLDADGNLTYDFKYGREYGTEDVNTVFVPFSGRYISKENMDRIGRMLPYSYKQINNIIE